MATYLYCVRSDVTAVPAGLTGVDGTAVRAIDAAGMAVWVSDVSEAAIAPTVERIKQHDAVCAAALAVGDTPLPIRFGQTFGDEAAATTAIASRQATLRQRLERVSGCVELRVVVTHGREGDGNEDSGSKEAGSSASPIVSAEGPGTAFLRRLAREGRADLAREIGCEEIRHALRSSAEPLVVDQLRCESARGLAFFPVLVRRPNVSAFRSAVHEILLSQRIALSVLGPFAPYSFAGDA